MKKSLVILVLSILAMSVPAQAEHLKFMGIPLTGTIAQFQKKLAAKGVSYNKAASERAEIGTRLFTGKFAGSKADIVVWYDADTKIVYGAKAVFECTSTSHRNKKYEELNRMLSSKYSEDYLGNDKLDGFDCLRITVMDGEYMLGMITLFQSDGEYRYDDVYYVQVEYLDAQNYVKNENSKMNDL